MPLHVHLLLLAIISLLCMKESELYMDESQVPNVLKLWRRYGVTAATCLAGFFEDLEGQVGGAPLALHAPVCMLQPHLHANTSYRASIASSAQPPPA